MSYDERAETVGMGCALIAGLFGLLTGVLFFAVVLGLIGYHVGVWGYTLLRPVFWGLVAGGVIGILLGPVGVIVGALIGAAISALYYFRSSR